MRGTEFWADPLLRWYLIGWLLASVGAVVWSMVAGRRREEKRLERLGEALAAGLAAHKQGGGSVEPMGLEGTRRG